MFKFGNKLPFKEGETKKGGEEAGAAEEKKRRGKKEVEEEPEEEEEEEEEEEGSENDDEIVIDAEKHGERPSVRAKLSMAAKAGVANRPRIPNDPPCLYRVFCATSQRVPCELSQLNSAAAYLFISDDDERVVVWAGEFATDSDFDLSQELALEVIRRDMRKFDATDVDDVIYEGEEKQVQELFEYFLDKLWTDESAYRGKRVVAERRFKIENTPISLGLLERWSDDTLQYREMAYMAPDENGTIGRIPFVPIEVDTVAISNIEDQWDVWISRGNGPEMEDRIKKFVVDMAVAKLEENSEMQASGVDRIVVSKNVRIVYQGLERVLYRRYFKVLTDYEPPGKTVPWKGLKRRKDGGSVNTGSAVNSLRRPEKESMNNKDENQVQGFTPFSGGDNANGQVGPGLGQGEGGAVRFGNEGVNTNIPSREALAVPLQVIDAAEDEDAPLTRLTEGRALITRIMLDFKEEENLPPELRVELLMDSIRDPQLLVGYQIEIDEGRLNGLHVITGRRTNFFGSHMFRLSSYESDDIWTKLQQGPKKSGVFFRPLRRVFT